MKLVTSESVYNPTLTMLNTMILTVFDDVDADDEVLDDVELLLLMSVTRKVWGKYARRLRLPGWPFLLIIVIKASKNKIIISGILIKIEIILINIEMITIKVWGKYTSWLPEATQLTQLSFISGGFLARQACLQPSTNWYRINRTATIRARRDIKQFNK